MIAPPDGESSVFLKSAIPPEIREIIDLGSWKGKEEEKRGLIFGITYFNIKNLP
jgi:hypothetical protein